MVPLPALLFVERTNELKSAKERKGGKEPECAKERKSGKEPECAKELKSGKDRNVLKS